MRVEAAMLEREHVGCVRIVAHTVLHTVRDGCRAFASRGQVLVLAKRFLEHTCSRVCSLIVYCALDGPMAPSRLSGSRHVLND